MVLHKFFSVAQTNEMGNVTFVFFILSTIKSPILIANLSHNQSVYSELRHTGK